METLKKTLLINIFDNINLFNLVLQEQKKQGSLAFLGLLVD